jgi:hypothetical protein
MVSSATILIKTPTLKYYDKGFITKYTNYTKVEIFNAGVAILTLKIYENKICKDTFECQSLKSFNAEYFSSNYKDDFIKELFEKNEKNTIFRDKTNSILIKIKRD